MDKLKIDFENCYGIRKLNFEFDFEKNRTNLIYAPNGCMKTSFAKTFMDFSKGEASEDLVYPDRINKRIITSKNGNKINKEQVFVIVPYNEGYKSQKVSTLLVNPELKKKYDKILVSIEEKKATLISELKTLTGLKKSIGETFSEDIVGYSQDEFFKAILRVKQEVLEVSDTNLSGVRYSEIFNPKVIAFLETEDFKIKIKEYIETYDNLIEKSIYFRKGVFNHNNASVVAKNLKDNGFFKAKHSVIMNTGKEKKEVFTEADLENLIQEEKESILNNPDLVKAFSSLDSKLKNRELKAFRDYLLNNKFLLIELSNLKKLKNDLWISYLKEKIDIYTELEEEYSRGRTEIDTIIEEAKKEETTWRSVIDIFNRRFNVPFKISVENQDDVILKQQAPNFKFVFIDRVESPMSIEENKLLKVLSNGEKRALYILNLIFEIEARKESEEVTLFIIDDIADSFDYKNKYAIIEYLKDNSDNPKFRQIILSHNFDFFRTVQGRILGNTTQRDNSFIAQKNNDEIVLSSAGSRNITNPFDVWKNKMNTNLPMLIATIPFIRNLVEFREGKSNNYKKLTSLLHIKEDTESVTISDISDIYKDTLKTVDLSSYPPDKKLLELIFKACEDIIVDNMDQSLNLENKIVLSIGIRLKAEEFMWSKVMDKTQINGNQTGKLFGRYKLEFSNESSEESNIELCSLVNLMTPENIHLNSFMYEPILDMSNDHLKELYTKIKSIG